MFFIKIILMGLNAVLLMSAFAMAHPGGHGHDHADQLDHAKYWMMQNGDYIQGTFESANEQSLWIRTLEGEIKVCSRVDLVSRDQADVNNRLKVIRQINLRDKSTSVSTEQTVAMLTLNKETSAPILVEHFKPFEKTVKTRWDQNYFYVESNGIPDHRMMVGITAWQQQVPMPQKYTGNNAWRIPLHPVPAKNPMSAKTNFFRGAIALAVNGVPIFNPIKNDGKTDTLLAGELDEFGGHCGRGDDYHYHIAPVHLEKIVGDGKPLAYALDGYPIYGYQDKTDKDYAPLDKLNGHKDAQGNYHYHATKEYPYINGGFYGEVVEAGGQVDPQPRAESPRPALTPLRDAKITDFKETKPGSYVLTYDVRGKKGTVAYTVLQDGSADFTFVDIYGKKSTEHYQSKPQRGGSGGNNPPPRRPGENPPPPRPGENNRPPRREDQMSKLPDENAPGKSKANSSGMTVSSSSVNEQGMLSVKCTCDGNSLSPAISWKNAPVGTKSYAISLWHTAPDMEKSYWVVYNIPATATELKEDSKNVGTIGINDRKKAEYDPMCSKGPGVKTYHITVYALSEVLSLDAKQASRAGLITAMKGKILAEETFDFKYERKGSGK